MHNKAKIIIKHWIVWGMKKGIQDSSNQSDKVVVTLLETEDKVAWLRDHLSLKQFKLQIFIDRLLKYFESFSRWCESSKILINSLYLVST